MLSFRCCTIRRALQALHYMQDFAGTTLYALLYRPSTNRRDAQALHYTQGCSGLAVYAWL